MSSSSNLFVLPVKLNFSAPTQRRSQFVHNPRQRTQRSIAPVARLFGPAIFEAAKLNVLFLGVEEAKHPGNLPRAYTLTHSDITAKLTLAISQTINRAQIDGWYNKLQRDEVIAQWKKIKGKMSLHVHCHISGDHFLLDLIAKFRYYIFSKELPVVLKAFVYGDSDLFNNYPELEESTVWVYFHSNLPEYNRVECWGSLREASSGCHPISSLSAPCLRDGDQVRPRRCPSRCNCCFPSVNLMSWPQDLEEERHQQHSLQNQ